MIHYPDAIEEPARSIRDMDLLIGERQRIGIHSTQDLSDYHMHFTSITGWLMKKNWLSELEQRRAYVRAFPAQLLNAITARLELKYPDYHQDDPFQIAEVHDTARAILKKSSSTSYAKSESITSIQSPAIKSESMLQIEHLGPLMAEFTKSIVNALKSPGTSQYTRPYGEKLECIMCGREHTIPNCDVVEDYIKAGKCKRNHENKVVLPSGSFVPRNTPGKWLCNRIDEWHRQHPNQLVSVNLHIITDTQVVIATG